MVVTEEASHFEGPITNTKCVVDQNSQSQIVSSTPSITEPTEQFELLTGF